MRSDAIFDNTVFNIAARIPSCNLIELALNLFENIFVPQQVFIEMQNFPEGYEAFAEKRMQLYVRQTLPTKKGLQLCTTYDPIVYCPIVLAMTQMYKGVDQGEAEAIAQAEKQNVALFFTDDQNCVDVLKDKYTHIQFIPTLRLITLLDVLGFLTDNPLVIKEYLDFKPFPQKNGKTFFREQYQYSLQYFGLPNDRKLISEKTSFKLLGL